MSAVFNPYAAPAARVEDVESAADTIRRAHIGHEASIKTVGHLYILGGIALTILGLVVLSGSGGKLWGLLLAAVLLALGIGHLFAGWGLRGLRRSSRVVGCAISSFGLLAFPAGTLINGYILYLLLSKKGRIIFSPEYQSVVAATPHIRYRTSVLQWFLIALALVLIAASIFMPPIVTR